MPAGQWLVTTAHLDMNSFVEAAVYGVCAYYLHIYIFPTFFTPILQPRKTTIIQTRLAAPLKSAY